MNSEKGEEWELATLSFLDALDIRRPPIRRMRWLPVPRRYAGCADVPTIWSRSETCFQRHRWSS